MLRLSSKPGGIQAAVAGVLALFVAMAPQAHGHVTPGVVQRPIRSGDLGTEEPFSSNPESESGAQAPADQGARAVGTTQEAEAVSTYMQCWEDKLGKSGDRGSNSLLIDIHVPGVTGEFIVMGEAAASEPLLIPLPPAVWSGLGGLLGVGVLGAIRRARGSRW